MNNLLNTVPQRIFSVATQNPHLTALYFRKKIKSSIEKITFQELWQFISAVGASFFKLGIQKGDHIAIISDNRKEWLFCDLAIMGLRAIDVPRGSDSNAKEIAYIIEHSDSTTVILENKTQLDKLLSNNPNLNNIKTIILLDSYEEQPKKINQTSLYSFNTLLEEGLQLKAEQEKFNQIVQEGERTDLASIIYTSGTTGNPKGVMLTQESFVFQLENIYPLIPIKQSEIMLSVLPIWHTFERICEYIVLNIGATIAYSKIIGPVMLNDLKELNPQWFVSVPRIWESIYEAIFRKLKKGNKAKFKLVTFFLKVSNAWYKSENLWNQKQLALSPINTFLNKLIAFWGYVFLYPLKELADILVFSQMRDLLGQNFVAGVSGGGALPPHVDAFFQSIGIKVLEGYGMTETGPVISVRRCDHPIMYTIGETLEGIKFEIRNSEGKVLPPCNKGRLFIQSPQVMMGYYKNEVATQQVLVDGWLDTGDLAIETYNNHTLKIVGRAKETIVLNGGENIEPAPIEEKITSSDLIDNAMVVGQDQKFLAAIICVNIENSKKQLEEEAIPFLDDNEFLHSEQLKTLIFEEVQKIISSKNGFRPFEKIYKIIIAEKTFTPDEELTKTLKLKRSYIEKEYRGQIIEAFKN